MLLPWPTEGFFTEIFSQISTNLYPVTYEVRRTPTITFIRGSNSFYKWPEIVNTLRKTLFILFFLFRENEKFLLNAILIIRCETFLKNKKMTLNSSTFMPSHLPPCICVHLSLYLTYTQRGGSRHRDLISVLHFLMLLPNFIQSLMTLSRGDRPNNQLCLF